MSPTVFDEARGLGDTKGVAACRVAEIIVRDRSLRALIKGPACSLASLSGFRR